MTEAQLHRQLVAAFPGSIGQLTQLTEEETQIRIKPEALHDICHFLLKTPELHFDFLRHIMIMPTADRLIIVYYLYSFEHGHQIALRMDVPKTTQELISVKDIWRGADQLEDESKIRLGVEFKAASPA